MNERGSTRTQCGCRELDYHIRGWNVGVMINAIVKGDDVEIRIDLTGGSSGAKFTPFTKVFKGKA
jgi:hypothetical protein